MSYLIESCESNVNVKIVRQGRISKISLKEGDKIKTDYLLPIVSFLSEAKKINITDLSKAKEDVTTKVDTYDADSVKEISKQYKKDELLKLAKKNKIAVDSDAKKDEIVVLLLMEGISL